MVLTRSQKKSAATNGRMIAAEVDSLGIDHVLQPTPSASGHCVSKFNITTCFLTTGLAALSSSNHVAEAGLNLISQDSKISIQSSGDKMLNIEAPEGTTTSRGKQTAAITICTSQSDARVHKSMSKKSYSKSAAESNKTTKRDELQKNEVLENEDHLKETVPSSLKKASKIGYKCIDSAVQADPARGNNFCEPAPATSSYLVTQSRIAGSSYITAQVTQAVSNSMDKACQSDPDTVARISIRINKTKATAIPPLNMVSPNIQSRVAGSSCTAVHVAQPICNSIARPGQSEPNSVARISTRSSRNNTSAIPPPTTGLPNIHYKECQKNATGCIMNVVGSATLTPSTAALIHATQKIQSTNTCQSDPSPVTRITTESCKNKASAIPPQSMVSTIASQKIQPSSSKFLLVSPSVVPPFKIPVKGKRSALCDNEMNSDADVTKSPSKKSHTGCTNKQNDVLEVEDKHKNNIPKDKNQHNNDAPKNQDLTKNSIAPSLSQKPVYHIKCTELFSDDAPLLEPIGEKCQLCGIDLAFTLTSSDARSGNLPFSAVLPCRHAFHDSCVNDIFGPHEPPCICCLEVGTSNEG